MLRTRALFLVAGFLGLLPHAKSARGCKTKIEFVAFELVESGRTVSRIEKPEIPRGAIEIKIDDDALGTVPQMRWAHLVDRTIVLEYTDPHSHVEHLVPQRIEAEAAHINQRGTQYADRLQEMKKASLDSGYEHAFVRIITKKGEVYFTDVFTSNESDHIKLYNLNFKLLSTLIQHNIDESEIVQLDFVHTHPLGSPLNHTDLDAGQNYLKKEYAASKVTVTAVSPKNTGYLFINDFN